MFSVRSGCSSSWASRAAPFRPSSSKVSGPDAVDPDEGGLAHGQDHREAEQNDDGGEDEPVGLLHQRSAPLQLLEPGHQLPLPALHHRGLVVLLMVEAEEMEHAVDHEQGHLVVEGDEVLRRLALRDLGADDDVAHEDGGVGRLGGRARAPAALVGLAATLDQLVVHGEGEHVGRSLTAEEPLVEVGHGLLVDEEHGQLGVAPHALLLEHHAGQAHPAERVDLDLGLLVGDKDLHGLHHLSCCLVGVTMSCTILCRTTSELVRSTKARPGMPSRKARTGADRSDPGRRAGRSG